MNILFLSLLDFHTLQQKNLYTDLLRSFNAQGHKLYVVSPVERRRHKKTHIITDDHATILKLRVGNIQKTNIIEKGISTLMIEPQFIAGIRRFFSDVKFDAVLYSTPPITFAKVIEYVKKRDHAKSYLLLKDIFPQNAVDIGMMSKSGLKGILYRHFRNQEKKLYALSDRIGCMSQANVDYVLKHNPKIDPAKVEICPNSIEIQDMTISQDDRAELRKKYGLPMDKKVFIYGGNLGRPQGIPFVMQCLESQQENTDAYFLIIGDGTEYKKLETWFAENLPANAKLLKRLPKEDYDRMVSACDVGMIFLDHRFTIPNFPSRLLGYLQAGVPVLACTDPNTDIGQVIVEGGFGWWCESNNTTAFAECVDQALHSDLPAMGQSGYKYLADHYDAQDAAQTILNAIIAQ